MRIVLMDVRSMPFSVVDCSVSHTRVGSLSRTIM